MAFFQYVLLAGLTALFTREYAPYVYQVYRYKVRQHHGKHLAAARDVLLLFYEVLASFLWQRVANNVREIGSREYEVTYYIHFKMYKIRARSHRGPSRYLQWIDDSTEEDITGVVAPYLGPNDNFHGTPFTASDFVSGSLTVNYCDGTTRTFKPDEVLE